MRNVKRIIGGIVVLIIISIIAAGYFINNSFADKAPLCKNGFMDLSDWDFNKSGNVKLNGYWEFYPHKLLSPADLNNESLQPDMYIKVPMRWRNQTTNPIMPDNDFGTYRLRIKVNKSTYMYGLKTINIRTAGRIFVNGREAGSSGNPAASFQEGYISNNVPIVAFFPSEGDIFDIIIQVSNLDYFNGGIIQSIYFGSQENILNYSLWLNIINIVCISFLVLSSIYYIGIYIKRREDKSFIYFSISCLAYAYVIATSDEKLLNRLFVALSFMLLIKLKIALTCISVIFTALFIGELGEDYIPCHFMQGINTIMLINIASILITPVNTIPLLEKVIFLLNILAYLLVTILIFRAIILQKYGRLNKKAAIFLLSGIIMIVVHYCSTLLYYYSIVNSNFMPIIILLLFLGGVAAMFSEKYSKAYLDLEIMSNRLIVADKTKDEFLINTSHEFKTPLHGIVNIAQSVLDRNDGNITKKQEENLIYIISLATKLSGLVNDIIDFESLQNSSLRLSKKTFDINGTVQAVIEVLKYMRKGDNIKLINGIPVGKYYIHTDENRFRQIMVNLISNSLKYTERGYVEIKADTIDQYIYISVRDTGIGMVEKSQKELFSGNRYTGDVNFTEYTSSGLGLSISKLLASNMGGDLYLEWSQLDKGSIFVVKLPEADEDKKKEMNREKTGRKCENSSTKLYRAESSNAVIDMRDQKKLKFLLVDDEPSNIKVLREIFDEEHYETLIAYNGSKALELIKNHRDISVVLLDVMMPGMSGYEVCKKIREEHRMFELPILLLTVRNTPEDIAAGLEAGANDFLVKPFDSRELKARVRTLQKMKNAVKDTIKMETVFLQSQIKPHFLYNALSVIMSLCYSDGERAGTLLAELSNYLRCSFDIDPYHSYISIKKEISLVKSYIELEKARFGDRLTVEFAIAEEVWDYRIPALIIQPLVENSVRHGLMKRISGGTVKIEAGIYDNELRILINDDGLGIPPEKLKNLLDSKNQTGSVGLINVNKRLFNEYGKNLAIESREREGTKVTIYIPIKMRNWE